MFSKFSCNSSSTLVDLELEEAGRGDDSIWFLGREEVLIIDYFVVDMKRERNKKIKNSKILILFWRTKGTSEDEIGVVIVVVCFLATRWGLFEKTKKLADFPLSAWSTRLNHYSGLTVVVWFIGAWLIVCSTSLITNVEHYITDYLACFWFLLACKILIYPIVITYEQFF